MELYISLAIPVLLLTAWFYTSQMTRGNLPLLRNKRICLLIAHPDDEAMFFSPTLAALTAPELGNHVKIICLSSGNADGLGKMRKQELAVSGRILGLRNENDVFVIEDDAFPDSMNATWPKDQIAQVLNSAFRPSQPKKKELQGPEATVDVIITFDGAGVSNHPNHISLYHGARVWLADLMRGQDGWKSPVELYTLSTVNIVRKYMSFLDGTATLTIGAFRGIRAGRKKMKTEPPGLVFISSFGEYWKGRDAMTKAHKSQMRWFRWGWITIGRYMIVNDLKREYV